MQLGLSELSWPSSSQNTGKYCPVEQAILNFNLKSPNSILSFLVIDNELYRLYGRCIRSEVTLQSLEFEIYMDPDEQEGWHFHADKSGPNNSKINDPKNINLPQPAGNTLGLPSQGGEHNKIIIMTAVLSFLRMLRPIDPCILVQDINKTLPNLNMSFSLSVSWLSVSPQYRLKLTTFLRELYLTEGSRNLRKSAKVVTMSLEAPSPPRQLVTAWGCGADPSLWW